MYTIISGTNRKDSYTHRVALEYQRFLEEMGIEAGILSLEGVNLLERDAAFEAIENEVIIPTDHYIFIVPEYNGSFPGALKLLFDTARSHKIWWNKKAMLTGIATGRAGNLRGMDHLASVLNHVKVTVYPIMQPISLIDKMMDEKGRFTDPGTIKVIRQQLEGFLDWSKEGVNG